MTTIFNMAIISKGRFGALKVVPPFPTSLSGPVFSGKLRRLRGKQIDNVRGSLASVQSKGSRPQKSVRIAVAAQAVKWKPEESKALQGRKGADLRREQKRLLHNRQAVAKGLHVIKPLKPPDFRLKCENCTQETRLQFLTVWTSTQKCHGRC